MTQIRSRRPIMNSYPEFDDHNEEEQHRRQSPPSSLSVNNSFTHQSSTMGSWGFDVNRSTNEQTLSHASHNTNNEQIFKDQNEQFVETSTTPQVFKLRTPTLTRNKNGNEFSAVDRLVLGPKRMTQRTQAEQELLAWRNRMLDRNQQQSIPTIKRNDYNNSSRSSTHQITTSMQPHSSASNTTEDQQETHELTIKTARVIKRYIELLYHLQTFYERITDQLYNGSTSSFLRTNQSIFTNHCRKIAEQLQNCKPIWEEKLSELQNFLRTISSSQISLDELQTTILQRRSTLINLFQSLSNQPDLDHTHQSIYSDIERLLHEDKLAVQLQDELSTLLQHQSLLNDFTSLLQWNRQIYSSNEQNRVESILPSLREQMTTNDSYISHVSQQLNELITRIRSSEKYILSYTNTIPLIDDAIGTQQRLTTMDCRDRWRPYDETELDKREHRESRSMNENLSKNRSISMSRFDEIDQNIIPKNLSSSSKINHSQLNLNNNNSNRSSTRLATIKPAKIESKRQLSSILKASHRKKTNLNIENDETRESQRGFDHPKRYDFQSKSAHSIYPNA